jgi:RNA recognition motif-containing protein
LFALSRRLSTLDLPADSASFFPVRGGFSVKIYVGNLSYSAQEDELREAFEAYGNVSSVSVVTDRETGRSRGFAFVEMPDGGQAKAAIEGLNLKQLGDRAITVNEARPREDRPRGGGGGYRGGGGGGGGGGRGGKGRW